MTKLGNQSRDNNIKHSACNQQYMYRKDVCREVGLICSIPQYFLLSLRTRSSENQKEGLRYRLGWKYPVMQARFKLVHNCILVCVYWRHKL